VTDSTCDDAGRVYFHRPVHPGFVSVEQMGLGSGHNLTSHYDESLGTDSDSWRSVDHCSWGDADHERPA
jgi:hypothetical protein